jgi:hypothetical protein
MAQKLSGLAYFGIPLLQLFRGQEFYNVLPKGASHGFDPLDQILLRDTGVLLPEFLDLGILIGEKGSELGFLSIRKVQGLTDSLQLCGHGI